MSDEAAKHFEAEAPAASAAPPTGRSVTLSVTLHPNNQIEFSAPANKILAYGLVGVALEQLVKAGLLGDLQQAKAANGGGVDGLLKRLRRH